MVSPSKIFEKAKSELNSVIFPLLNKAPKKHGGSKIKSQRRATHSTLLESTRFYLDIRNKALLSKVESTLKSYGAKIELFFRKDIKVIVTDKPEWIGSGRSPSSSISPLTTPSPYMLQEQRFAVPKSRASAMLEKVSQQPASPYCSPLELAQKWRIRILSVRNLWKWIAKVEEAYVAKIIEKKKEKALLENKVISPKNNTPFIKIESIDSSKTPEFLELESWPRLNLDGRLGQCPFRSPFLPNPIRSDNKPKEESNKLFEVKDKVAVELIQYNTDFKIKDSVKLGDWEAEVEQLDASKIHNSSESGLSRVSFKFKMEKKVIQIKMTRRPVKSNIINEEEPTSITDKRSISPFYNGHLGRNITRQSSQELLKVQCNGLTSIHRNSKLLSPSGSDVLPLPTSRRSTRRASASWCGSTRELSQLSPTDSEIENIRRSESSLETHDPVLDSPGITLRPKGQLWLPIALIGTTAEENGNCIRKRYDYSIKQSENAKLSSDLLDDKQMLESEIAELVPQLSKEADSTLHSGLPQSEHQMKKIIDRKDTYCIITRNTKIKNEEVNGRSRESSVESLKAYSELSKDRTACKKRSFSVCGRTSPTVKRIRTLSTNSVYSIGRKKKLSPEEKLLRDNKEYFKMEVLNTKLRSTGSLLNVDQNKEQETNVDNAKLVEKIDKIIIKKIKIGRKRRRKKWANANVKKGDEGHYATVMLEKKKKHNIKINGVIRKKRQSELMKLCHEAESFMFGDCNRHGLGANSVENTAEESPRKKISLIFSNRAKESWTENNQKGNNYGVKEGKAKKKRRSHAEAFIHDNLDYYKFETPGSRLRYQGNLLDIKSEDKDFIYTLKQKKKEKVMPKHSDNSEQSSFTNDANEESLKTERKKNNFIPSAEVEKILFSFESIPITEPWYEVYKRQDEGMENYYPLLSDPNDQPFLLPYEMPKPIYSKLPTVREYYKRRRKKLVHLFNHPRKSPRCHASTLAILSSLKKRKRRSGTNISVNSVLTISSMNNLNGSDMKSSSRDQDSAEKNEFVNEEILDFFYNDSDSEKDELLLEPFSDSESQPKRKNSDSSRSVKSDEEDIKNVKFCCKNKKLSKLADSKTDCDNSLESNKQFLWQMINSESFSKDMLIETRKKSGLPYNIAAILENCKNCKSMEESDSDFISGPYGGCSKESPDKIVRRRKKKARKINKTGWDNRKSRRRTGYKVAEVKDVECSEEKVKPSRGKAKLRIRENGINSDNIISDTKRKLRRRETGRKNMEDEDKPVLRSHIELSSRLASLRRSSQDRESISSSADSAVQDYPRCVVRVKKIADSALDAGKTIKYSNRKYAIQKKSLILNRKKKRIIDYAWSTKKR